MLYSTLCAPLRQAGGLTPRAGAVQTRAAPLQLLFGWSSPGCARSLRRDGVPDPGACRSGHRMQPGILVPGPGQCER